MQRALTTDRIDEFHIWARRIGVQVLLCMACLIPASDLFAQRQSLQTWAIVAAEDVERDSLPDLLSARLSSETDIQLVERVQLARVTDELQLTSLLGASDSEHRIEFGRLVGADALVLLSTEDRDKQQVLTVTLSECRYGARLRLAVLPYEARKPETLAVECAAMVSDVRKHFAGGISHMIGIPPFLSRNLSHEFDHLQIGLARLLEESLLSVPGMAVLEFQEARAIQDELNVTGRPLADRVVPLIVEGEYEVAANANGESPTVQIRLRLMDGGPEPRTIEPPNLTLDTVPEFLLEDLREDILSSTKPQPKLDRAEQFRIITKRADQFGALGFRARSVELREAALLLNPQDAEQRLQLIAERVELQEEVRRYEDLQIRQVRRSSEKLAGVWEPIRDRRLDDWRIRLVHVEYLIRNRLINPREAGHLIWECMAGRKYVGPDGDDLQRADEFFWHVAPLIDQLDYSLASGQVRRGTERSYDLINLQPEKWSRTWQTTRWTAHCYEALADGQKYSRPPDPNGNARTSTHERVCDDLYRFMTTVVPIDAAPSWLHLWRSEFRDETYRELYERLAASTHVGAQIFSRHLLLAMDAMDRNSEPTMQMLAEADSLLNLIEAQRSPVLRTYRDPVAGIRTRIADRLEQMAGTVLRKRPLPMLEPYKFDTLGRVSWQATGVAANDWVSLTRCSVSLDLIYSFTGVSVMREPGQTELVWGKGGRFMGDKDLYSARWDGRFIWIATTLGGVHVITPDGKSVAVFDSESGLPSYRKSRESELVDYLLLHPLGQGRCLAVGAFGRDDRVWFAVLDANQDAAQRVKVFHRLTEVSGQRDDPELIGNIGWLKPYRLAGGADKLLVQRLKGTDSPFPLVIDPQTLEVTSLPVPCDMPQSPRQTSDSIRDFSILPNGTVLYPMSLGVEHFDLQHGRNWRQLPQLSVRTDVVVDSGWIELEDRILYFGGHWNVINKHSGKSERLTNGPVPWHWHFEHHGVSAHYGPVAWEDRGALTQILIDSQTSTDDELEAWEHIPEPHRRSHAMAAREFAIRRVIVGPTICRLRRSMPSPFPGTHVIPDATICFSAEWQPNVQDLKRLSELHDVKVLDFRGAGLSNDHLAALPSLSQLEKLILYDTNVTDSGLAELTPSKLPTLELLHLASADEKHGFTDDGLAHVVRLSRLKELTLSGAKFTDAAVPTLAQLPPGCKLCIDGTRISRAALAKLEEDRPDIFWRIE